ncbi:MAG: hypothetical protein LBC30_04135 [Puniceicoccales bacterium]|jgi:hypothetical protein|nr:hypothetical protein [Puniceicoccales bacterium]
MKSFEEICCGVVKQPKFIKNATIGFILGLIPIINFLAFGYLVGMGKPSTNNENLSLPDWPNIKGNLKNVLIKSFFLGVIAFFEFILIPCLLCFSIFGLAELETFGTCVGLFISAPAFAYATVSDSLKIPRNVLTILKDFAKVYKWVFVHYKKLAIPSALFLCFQVVASFAIPYLLMGAPMFLGLLFMVSYVKQMSSK